MVRGFYIPWRTSMTALRGIPHAELTADEQAFIDGPLRELVEIIDDYKLENEGVHIPQEILDFLGKNKFSLIIPKVYGGLEFSPFANSTIVSKIAARVLVSLSGDGSKFSGQVSY